MDELEELSAELESKNINFLKNVLLSEYSNTKTGGNTPLMVYPKDITQLKFVLNLINQKQIQYQILGDMTNVAIASGQLNFIVVDTCKILEEPTYTDDGTLVVTAGYKMKELAKWALDNSISSLAWMEGIPGTVGAGAYMNAGFLPGQDFESFLVSCEVLMPDMSIKIFKNSDMHYSYRHSQIQNNGGIVLRVKLLVRKGKKWKIAIRMAKYHHRRAKNQPLELPSAGTVFVPPTPYHVGGLLPQLGLVGHRIGGAQISPKSPGFIVGIDNMTGEDYYEEVKFIQKQVKDNYNIDLEPEVRLLGFENDNAK